MLDAKDDAYFNVEGTAIYYSSISANRLTNITAVLFAGLPAKGQQGHKGPGR